MQYKWFPSVSPLEEEASMTFAEKPWIKAWNTHSDVKIHSIPENSVRIQ